MFPMKLFICRPWWKTDYFEVKYENPAENKRYFYQLDGEGVRYELVELLKSAGKRRTFSYIDSIVAAAISKVIEDYESGNTIAI